MKLFCNVAVIVVLSVMLSVLPATDATAKCEAGDNGPKCASCARKGTCAGVAAGGDVKNLEACPTDKACTMVSGLAVCMPTAETECNCGGRTKGCDIYDPQWINICVPYQRPIQAQLCADSQVCSDAKCVGPADDVCIGKDDLGLALGTPYCASAALCYKNEVIDVEWCGPGQYFNVDSKQCEVYSPDPCANCGESMCPILSDCTKYAACANGQLVRKEACAPSGTNFDFTKQMCTADSAFNNSCSAYIGCNFDLIATTTTVTATTTTSTATTPTTTTPTTTTPTTTTPTTTPTTTTPTTTTPTTTRPPTCTAANADQNYPHETNCKKFYTCRKNENSNYQYEESSCRGKTVFDPISGDCASVDKMPGCNP